MLKINHAGFSIKSLSILCLVIILLVSSCDQEDQIVPDQTTDASLEKYYTFLEQASGVNRDKIVYNERKASFTVSKDMIVSKVSLDEYLAAGNATPDGRTEQRSHSILLSDAYATNFKYYIQPSLTPGWHNAVIQALEQWNKVGLCKLQLVQVPTEAESDINVFMGSYDAEDWIARATLPSGNGKGILEINPRFNDMASGQKLFAMAHEIGHNIGFLHTDENTGNLIPGTPVTDTKSVMNSFILPWNGFTDYDLAAVRHLYPGSTTIQAEAYSAMSGVQIDACTDTGRGLNVGSIDHGDWLEYKGIKILSPGSYRIEYRVASANDGGELTFILRESLVGRAFGTVKIPNTGGWQNWTTVSQTVVIPADTHYPRFIVPAGGGGWNINWFRITKL